MFYFSTIQLVARWSSCKTIWLVQAVHTHSHNGAICFSVCIFINLSVQMLLLQSVWVAQTLAPLANTLALFTSEECQQKGRAKMQWNSKLPLAIVLQIGNPFFLSTDTIGFQSMFKASNQLPDVTIKWIFLHTICRHHKSTDSVM